MANRIWSLCVGLMISSAALPQVKLQVTISGKAAGVATATQKLRPDGSKQMMLAFEIKTGSGLANFRSESVYSSSGAPIRKFQEFSFPSQKLRKTVVATFDATGAKVVIDENGNRTVKTFALDAQLPREDLSEFWFIRDQPKPGTSIKTYVFNMDKLSWELVETTFIGTEEITVGGKKYKSFKTRSDRGTAFVDSQGNPILLEVETGKMERIAG